MEHSADTHLKRFNLLISKIDGAYHDAALRLGLSDSAMLVLYTVSCGGGECPLQDITSWASKQTINSALRKLEADHMIRLEVFEGRKKKVCLTDRGRLLAKDTVFRLIHLEHEIFGLWSEEEKAVYLELTHRYLTAFREKIKEL